MQFYKMYKNTATMHVPSEGNLIRGVRVKSVVAVTPSHGASSPMTGWSHVSAAKAATAAVAAGSGQRLWQATAVTCRWTVLIDEPVLLRKPRQN
jgi:hypothetical protein